MAPPNFRVKVYGDYHTDPPAPLNTGEFEAPSGTGGGGLPFWWPFSHYQPNPPLVGEPPLGSTPTTPNTGALPPGQTPSGMIPASGGSRLADILAKIFGGKGSASDWLSLLGGIGGLFGSLGKGRAEGRRAELDATSQFDRNAVYRFLAQLEANKNQNQFGLDKYRAASDTSNFENTFGLNAGRLGLDYANAENSFGLNRARLGQDAADAENQFGLGVGNLDLNRANAANSFALGRYNAGLAGAGVDLAQRRFALDAPGQRAGNAVRGDILANAKDATISAPSTIPKFNISGGLRPSMFSDATRQLGTNMSASARDQQVAGDTFNPLPSVPDYQGPSTALPTYRPSAIGIPGYKAPSTGIPTYKPPSIGLPDYTNPPDAPTLTPPPNANGFDSFLNGAGGIGAFLDWLAKRKTQTVDG